MKSCTIPAGKSINSHFNQNISLLSVFTQAYFRQGVALQYLGRHADALAAFASGLAQDPKSLQLLVGMVEAAMKSPLRGTKGGNCDVTFVHFVLLLCHFCAKMGKYAADYSNVGREREAHFM